MDSFNQDFNLPDFLLGSLQPIFMNSASEQEPRGYSEDLTNTMAFPSFSNQYETTLEIGQSEEPEPENYDAYFGQESRAILGSVEFGDSSTFAGEAPYPNQTMTEEFVSSSGSSDDSMEESWESSNQINNEQFSRMQFEFQLQLQSQPHVQVENIAEVSAPLASQIQTSAPYFQTSFTNPPVDSALQLSVDVSSHNILSSDIADQNNLTYSTDISQRTNTLQFETYEDPIIDPGNIYDQGLNIAESNTPEDDYFVALIQSVMNSESGTNEVLENLDGSFAPEVAAPNFSDTNIDIFNFHNDVGQTVATNTFAYPTNVTVNTNPTRGIHFAQGDTDRISVDNEHPQESTSIFQQSSDSLASMTESFGTNNASSPIFPTLGVDFSAFSAFAEYHENSTNDNEFATATNSLVTTNNGATHEIHGDSGAFETCEQDHTHHSLEELQESINDGTSDRPKTPKKKKRKFDYSKVTVEHTVFQGSHLQNRARGDSINDQSYDLRGKNQTFRDESPIIRTRYHRGNLDALKDLDPDVIYQKNPLFHISCPYQQEFTRVEVDLETGETKNTTRCGLCAYCPKLTFHELKNSAYAQHMAQRHGVFTNGYLTPNPLWRGQYKVCKKKTPTRKTNPRTRHKEAVVCPACFEVIEVSGASSRSRLSPSARLKKNPLLMYLRHFLVVHRVDKKSKRYFKLSVPGSLPDI
ncbi:hypothetical protein JCM33374_g5473 [Metschnikowia sp. JCM 33374]|nr:hypothetical protein JCM33374_g5473 [Metschnikowia sp. JCM 33374]